MRVYENDSPLPRINIRPRFDFDSDKPVQGITMDEEKEKAKTVLWHYLIHTALAINVALFGFWLMGWWVTHSGLMFTFMSQHAPALIRMVTTGQL